MDDNNEEMKLQDDNITTNSEVNINTNQDANTIINSEMNINTNQTENIVENNNIPNNDNKPKKHNWLLITAVIIFIIALVFYIWYGNLIKEDDKAKDNKQEEKSTPTPTLSPTITPPLDNEKTIDMSGKLIKKDNEMNSYYYDDGYVIKYNEDGEFIKKGSIKIKDIFNENYVFNDNIYAFKDNIYFVIDIDNTAYLYDFMDDSTHDLTNKYCNKDDDTCSILLSINLENLLTVDMYYKDNKDNIKQTFIYDTLNKTLSKRPKADLAGQTFKSKDGKNVLKIANVNDSEVIKDAKKYGVVIDDDINRVLSEFEDEYYGYFNNKFFLIFRDAEGNFNLDDSKYMVLGGTKEGEYQQCRDTHSFVINREDNSLIVFKTDYGSNVVLHRVGDNYYFAVGGCALGFFSDAIYNEQLKKIGEEYYGKDSNNNLYVLNSNVITKYNSNGESIKTNPKKHDSQNLSYSYVITNDTIYFLLLDNEKVYLLNGLTDEKYELGSKKKITFSNFEEYPGAEVREKDGLIIIQPSDALDENYKFIFNINTKELKKN